MINNIAFCKIGGFISRFIYGQLPFRKILAAYAFPVFTATVIPYAVAVSHFKAIIINPRRVENIVGGINRKPVSDFSKRISTGVDTSPSLMNTYILSTLTHDAIGKCRESFSPHFTAPYGDLHSIFLELKFILQFMNGFYRPDSVGVFFDRAVSREESRVRDIHKRHLIKRLLLR